MASIGLTPIISIIEIDNSFFSSPVMLRSASFHLDPTLPPWHHLHQRTVSVAGASPPTVATPPSPGISLFSPQTPSLTLAPFLRLLSLQQLGAFLFPLLLQQPIGLPAAFDFARLAPVGT